MSREHIFNNNFLHYPKTPMLSWEVNFQVPQNFFYYIKVKNNSTLTFIKLIKISFEKKKKKIHHLHAIYNLIGLVKWVYFMKITSTNFRDSFTKQSEDKNKKIFKICYSWILYNTMKLASLIYFLFLLFRTMTNKTMSFFVILTTITL